MALLFRNGICNSVNVICKRSIYVSSIKLDKYTMPDTIDHATGLEKRELLAMAAGNEHPFDMKVFKRTSGELSNPTQIPSMNDSRIVGCICHEDDGHINWMWLSKGQPKRCECGYFFQLIDATPLPTE